VESALRPKIRSLFSPNAAFTRDVSSAIPARNRLKMRDLLSEQLMICRTVMHVINSLLLCHALDVIFQLKVNGLNQLEYTKSIMRNASSVITVMK